MSQAEAAVFIQWGRMWFAHVRISDNAQKRDEMISVINRQLNALGFKIGRGWQDYDPVVRKATGRPTSYAQLVGWASRQGDGGKAAAQMFLNWATDAETGLLHMPTELQDMAIITHFAEVGRGYASALTDQLYPLMAAIAGGKKTWGNMNDFSPSLKYAEDGKMDWSGT